MMEKIDFVLPWVDSSDRQWQQQRQQYAAQNSDHDANAQARFRDMETLKYALRAIEANCPWYNRIFLITEGHAPDWLDLDHPKITLVSHSELFFDTSHLPVFNSSAIEMNLPNLKGLSDKFVYMNDDFIIFNPLKPERFFQEDKPVDFFSHHFLPRNRLFGLLRGRDTWIHSLNNNLTLLNRRFAPLTPSSRSLFHPTYTLSDKVNNLLLRYVFKKLLWLNHWHHPQPYLKQILCDVYEAFSEEMTVSSQNRFRAENDLTQYLYRYWQLVTENFYPYKHNDGFVANVDSLAVLEGMIERLTADPHINFVCFNDSTGLTNEEFVKVKKRLTGFLETRFPYKASFER